MKVLVTGGAGFIGTALIQALKAEGLSVRAIDVASIDEPGVEYIPGSILDRPLLFDAANGCDAIIHLAAMLGVRKTDSQPLRCLNVNIDGSVNVCEAALVNGIKRVIFSSSSEVYGDVSSGAISETSPLNPKSVYAVSKIAAEEYLKGHMQRYGFEPSIVRFFNVYGINQVAEFVLPRFVRMAMEGLPLTVYGDGKQVRSFCYMEDAARGVVKALLSSDAVGEVFNIGNDQEPISVTDLAQRVISVSGRDIPLKYVQMEESDRKSSREIYMRRPDITKARTVLGYEPQVSLDEGIKRLFEHGRIPESWIEPLPRS